MVLYIEFDGLMRSLLYLLGPHLWSVLLLLVVGTTSGLLSGAGSLLPGGRGAELAVLPRADTDHVGVDRARHAILELDVDLGELVVTSIDGLVHNIPHSCRLHNVADNETLDSLVLGHTASAVGAPDEPHVPTSGLSASSIPAFLGHLSGSLL